MSAEQCCFSGEGSSACEGCPWGPAIDLGRSMCMCDSEREVRNFLESKRRYDEMSRRSIATFVCC